MKFFGLLVLAVVAKAQFPSLDLGLRQDSALFTFYNTEEERAFLQYAPADPTKSDNMSTLVYTTEGNKGEYWGLTSSYEHGLVFVNNYRTPALLEYDVNKDKLRVIFKDMTQGVENLAYDRVTRTLYWCDSINKVVMAVEKSYRHFTPIYEPTDVSPYALALHVTKRKLIFSVHKQSDGFISGSKLLVSDLDGKNMNTLFRFPQVIRVLGITIDYSEDRLYWTDIDLFQNTIVQASNFDGSGRRQFFSQSKGLLWGIAHFKNMFYVTDIGNFSETEYQIHVRNKDGVSGTKIIRNMRPRNVNIYGPNEVSKRKVINECDGSKCDHVCLASRSGRHSCRCSPGYQLELDGSCTTNVLSDNYLLFADIGQKRLFQMTIAESAYSVTKYNAIPFDDKTDEKIYSMTVDKSNGMIVWFDLDNKKIHWGRNSFSFTTEAVTSMDIDTCSQTLFWSTSRRIYKREKTGFSSVKIYSLPFFTSMEIRQIAIDSGREHIYWSEYDIVLKSSKVWRMDFDGGKKELVLTDLPIIKAVKIDYETYHLYVASMTEGTLYRIPLKNLDSIPSTDPDYSGYKTIAFGTDLPPKVFVIFDFEVVNGHVYLLDALGKQMRRFSLRSGTSSMETYGPEDFYYMTTVTYYNRRHYQKYIRPFCATTVTSPPTTTTTTTRTTTIKTSGSGPSSKCGGMLKPPFSEANLNRYFACLISQMFS